MGIEESRKCFYTTTWNDFGKVREKSNNDINLKLGMNNPTFLELVKGRDSVSIPFMLKIQNALGIEIVSKDRLTQSCIDYINFIFHTSQSRNHESINP